MRRPGPSVIALVLVGLAVAGVGVVVGDADLELDAVLVAVVVATTTIGELLPLPRVRGRAVPTSVAVIGTFALLGAPYWAVIGVAVAGRVIAAALQRRFRQLTAWRLLRSAMGGFVAAGAVGLGSRLPWELWPELGVHPGSATALTAVIVLGLPWWESLDTDEDDDTPLLQRLVLLVEANWMTELALASTALLGAVVYPTLSELAIPFVLLPVLAARSGLKGYLTVRVQHDQTIRAISRLPEELGEVAAGHGQRTADLATTVARALGLSSADRERLVRASQLHELGRIRHEPGEDHGERTIALNGASILHQSGMSDIATIVGTHRDHVLGTDQASTILRLACELDLALSRTGDRTRALAAVADRVHDPAELRLLGAFDLDAVRIG